MFRSQSLQDFAISAIAEFIAKIKQNVIFARARKYSTDFGLRHVPSSQCASSQRKVVSQFEKWNGQPCILIMPDLQELHWTNEPKAN